MQEGRSPLMYACISGRLDLVKMLVINHADVAAVDCVSIYYLPIYVRRVHYYGVW